MSNIIIFEDEEEYIEYNGKGNLININDKHLLNEYSWYYHNGYLATDIPFHTLIMNFKPKLNPKLSIDHKNRDKLDNRKCNLRVVDKSTQAINRTKKSVISGVFTTHDYYGNLLYWVGRLIENGSNKQKSFSIKKYGYEQAKELAIKYRENLLKESKYDDKLKYEENKTNIIFEDEEEYVEYKGKKILIDTNDKHFLNLYSWRYDKDWYLKTTMTLHTMIMNFKPLLNTDLSIDHINRNKLDNTKNNLRVVNKTIQAINIKIKSNNTSGTVGVWLEDNRRCVAGWRENGKSKTKSFAIKKYGEKESKELAIKHRKEEISKIDIYKIALGL